MDNLIFSQRNKEEAMVFEAAVGYELARYYKAKAEKLAMPTKTDNLSEAMAKTLDGLKYLKEFESAIELLKNIESGKYRFLFMALARYFERFAEEHNIDLNPFEGGD